MPIHRQFSARLDRRRELALLRDRAGSPLRPRVDGSRRSSAPASDQEAAQVNDALSLIGSLFIAVVANTYAVIAGTVDRREGLRRIVAGVGALAVAVLLLVVAALLFRALAWLAGAPLLEFTMRLVRAF
jgi:hypothetical protein